MAGIRPSGPRAVVVYAFVAVMVLLFSCAILLERTVAQGQLPVFDADLPVQYREVRQESSNGDVFATVKGSIYENGSAMTVFGACQNAKGALLPNATATFTAWYPNGSVQTGPNVSMVPIYDGTNTTGRFRIALTMPDVVGTYFTEMRCAYKNDVGLAFGEWQNPEWVYKIGRTLAVVLGLNQSMSYVTDVLVNLSNNVDVYHNVTQQNLSQLYALLSSLNVTVGNQTNYSVKLKEIYNLKYDIAQLSWVMDAENVVYVLGSGDNNFAAVDVLDRNNVVAVGEDGEIAAWNGDAWAYAAVANTSWMGVSVLRAPVQYYWSAGLYGQKLQPIEISFLGGGPLPGFRTAVYSINGGQPRNVSWYNGSFFSDVKIFNQPNRPGENYYAFLLGDTGQVLFSNDGGVTWVDFMASLGAPQLASGLGRISNVVANEENTTEGYRIAFVTRDGTFAYYDGVNVSYINVVNVSLADVSLLRDGVAYVVGFDVWTGTMRVYRYEGGSLSEMYATESVVVPAGISAIAEDDIWIATADPAVFYHFDGFKWEYMADPFTAGLGVVISFGNLSYSTAYGVRDISMQAGAGYVVGADGLIMKLWSVWDERFDELMGTNGSIEELKGIVLAMNQSLMNETQNIQNVLFGMNVTQQQILSNVTYMNQYMTTIIGPALTDILVYLGIIDAKLNTTIELQNQTLQIVNATDAKVDDLIAKSERPRAWTTQ